MSLKRSSINLLVAALLASHAAAFAQGNRPARRAQGSRQRAAARRTTPPQTARTATTTTAATTTEPVRTLRGRMLGSSIEARMIDDRPSFEYRITSARKVDGKLELQGTITPALRYSNRIRPGAANATLVSTLAKFRRPDDPAGLTTVGLSAALPSRYSSEGAPAQASGGAQNRGQGATQVGQATTTAQLAAGQPVVQQQGGAPSNPETAARDSQLSQATQSAAGTPTGTPTAPGGQQPAQNATGVTAQITEAPVQTRALTGAQEGTTTGCEVMFLRMNIPAQLVALWETGTKPVQLGVMVSSLDNKQGAQINERICRVARLIEDRRPAAEADAEVASLNELLRSDAQSKRPGGTSGGR